MITLNIKSNRLQIRNLKHSDLEDFYAYRSNPDVTRYQGFDVMDRHECASYIKSQEESSFGRPGEWTQYGIEHTASTRLIGDCAIKLQAAEPRIAEVGITISHLHQQKGYAKEAFLRLLAFLFEEVKVHRVEETVDVLNIPSINLLISSGFRQEGHFIENIFFKGAWGSEYQFAMLRREWLEGSA